MKNYIVGTIKELDKTLRDGIESILNATGGSILRVGEAGYTVEVKASEEAIAKIGKLNGIDFVEENRPRIIKRPGVKPPRFGQ